MTETAPPPAPEEAALVRREGMAMGFSASAGVRLQNFTELLAFGKAMIESRFVPKGFDKPAQVVWAVQRGAELGLGPTAALDAFYVSPAGAPELYAEAALGICVASGKLHDDYDKWTTGEGDQLTGHFRFRRRGWAAPKERSFSVAEAKRAELVKPGSNWIKWPQRMVLARVVSFALHDFFADVLLGCAIEGDIPVEVQAATVQEQPGAPRRELAAPATPDPLLESVIDAERTTPEPEPAVREDAPPFDSHAEADRQLADADGAQPGQPQMGQARLPMTGAPPPPRRHRG